MDLPCCAALRCAARCILRSAHGVQAVATWPQRIWSRRRHGPQARRRLRHKCRACATKSIKSAHSVRRAHQCCTHVCRTFCAGPFMCRTLHSSRATCNVGVPHSSASLRSCMLVACCNLRAACNRSENVACRSMLHVAGASFMLQRCCTVCCTLMVHVVNAATTHSPFACSTRRYESTSPLAMRVARTKSCI